MHPYTHAPIHPIHPCSHTETQVVQYERVMRAGPEISAGLIVSRRLANVSSWRSLLSVPALVSASSALVLRLACRLTPAPGPLVFYGDAKNRDIDGPSHVPIATYTGFAPGFDASVDRLCARLVRSPRARDGCRRSSHRPPPPAPPISFH